MSPILREEEASPDISDPLTSIVASPAIASLVLNPFSEDFSPSSFPPPPLRRPELTPALRIPAHGARGSAAPQLALAPPPPRAPAAAAPSRVALNEDATSSQQVPTSTQLTPSRPATSSPTSPTSSFGTLKIQAMSSKGRGRSVPPSRDRRSVLGGITSPRAQLERTPVVSPPAVAGPTFQAPTPAERQAPQRDSSASPAASPKAPVSSSLRASEGDEGGWRLLLRQAQVWNTSTLCCLVDISVDTKSPDRLLVVPFFFNPSLVAYSDFICRAAAPRYIDVHMGPSSSSFIPPGRQGSSSLRIQLANQLHGQRPMRLQLRIEYKEQGRGKSMTVVVPFDKFKI
uniref:GAE domain-containing protein n=1 Tax=Guillardia theta TaxID=55529 RepID=A0A7S4J803_GUITH